MDYVIIWEEVPDNVKIFRFKDLDEQKVMLLKSVHGKYLGTSDLSQAEANRLEEVSDWLHAQLDKVVDEPIVTEGACTIIVAGQLI